MSTTLKIILKSGKDDAVRRFHPWVFSGAIKKIEGAARNGCHAEVFSNKDEYLGCGIYQDATIAVRLLAFAPERPETFGPEFWYNKLKNARQLRAQAGLTDNSSTNVYRLTHGEGDHVPGLIIDHYDGLLVIQIHATGLYNYISHIADALKNLYGSHLKGIYDKSRETLPDLFREQLTQEVGISNEHVTEIEVLENNHRFLVDIKKGQKTGFFIDQRDNRQLLTHYCQDKKVLNTFSYSGGFSVYALQAGASEVHSLDSSARAIELAEQNLARNFNDVNHRSITDDALQYLRQTDESYDVIVLDPPAYAKHQHVKHKAVQGYKRLNLEALKKMAMGGILFTFSCSQVVDTRLFYDTVTAAAILAGRNVRVLHRLSQPADHPVNIFHPEGQYLKGLVLRVD